MCVPCAPVSAVVVVRMSAVCTCLIASGLTYNSTFATRGGGGGGCGVGLLVVVTSALTGGGGGHVPGSGGTNHAVVVCDACALMVRCTMRVVCWYSGVRVRGVM